MFDFDYVPYRVIIKKTISTLFTSVRVYCFNEQKPQYLDSVASFHFGAIGLDEQSSCFMRSAIHFGFEKANKSHPKIKLLSSQNGRPLLDAKLFPKISPRQTSLENLSPILIFNALQCFLEAPRQTGNQTISTNMVSFKVTSGLILVAVVLLVTWAPQEAEALSYLDAYRSDNPDPSFNRYVSVLERSEGV